VENENSKKQIKSLFNLFIPIIIILILLFIFGSSIIKERFKDMDILLEKASLLQNRNRAFLINSKIKLLKQRIKAMKESSSDFISESKMQQIINFENNSNIKTKTKDTNITRKLIAFIRLLMGKPSNIRSNPIKENGELEKGYLFEVSRHYAKAILIYENLLKKNKNRISKINNYLHLHLGFCYAMLGQYEESKKIYLNLIKSTNKKDIKTIALNLLDFFIDAEKRITTYLKNSIDPVSQAERLYYFRDFKNAEKLLNNYLLGKKKKQAQKAKYLLGRCLEEQGNLKKALSVYIESILLNQKSFWAKMSNRRLFIIGKIYEKNKKLTRIAKKTSINQNDNIFIRDIERLVEALPNPKIKDKITGKKLLSKKMENDLTKLHTSKKNNSLKSLPKSYQKSVSLLSKHYKTIHCITMKDGNVFIGSIIKKGTTKTTIATIYGYISLGKIDIKSSKIIYRR